MTGPKHKQFARRLKRWFFKHQASYPWRLTQDPYAILIAELMLHRTRAAHVRSVYTAFISRYPNIDAAVSGAIPELKEILYPLGLTGRAERIMLIMQELKSRFGTVPADRESLLSIYGIGPYIAGAVAVFSRNTPEVLVDTNVVRVVGRVLGLTVDERSRRRKEMIAAIEQVMDRRDPRTFYFAIIDHAHQICRPQKPLCDHCPLQTYPCQFAQWYGTVTGQHTDRTS